MARPALREYDGVADHDHMVQLHEVSWADYEHLLAMRGDHSAPRYTYLQGELEIMSPSKSHESIKSILGRLVEVYCLERGIEFLAVGSWTIKNQEVARGIEPDECYVFGEEIAADAQGPDLAIEVIWTSGGIKKLEVYRKLGVAEVWIWKEGELTAYGLDGETYEPLRKSRVLAGIDLKDLEGLVESPTTSRAMRDYRALLQG